MRSVALLAVVFLGALPAAWAQRPMTPEDVMALRGVSDPQIAPDGRSVAFVTSTADLKTSTTNTDLWLVSTEGGTPVRLTTSPKSDTRPRWSPDGRRIAFLSAREERAQIWLISPWGGEAEPLTSHKTPVQEIAWSPDGTRIAFVATRAPSPEAERRQKEKDDPRVVDSTFAFAQLWAVDVATGNVEPLVEGEFHVSDPAWSPDGSRISYTAVPTPRADDGGLSDVWVLDLAGRKSTRLLDHPGPDFGARWSPDGSRIALMMRSGRRATGQSKLVTVPAAGGVPREVAPGFRYQPGSFAWSPDGRRLGFIAPVGTTSQYFTVAAEGGAPKQESQVEGVLAGGTGSNDGSVLAFTYSDTRQPAEVHVVRGRGGFVPASLTDMNPQVRDLALGQSEVIRWKGRDGREIEGVVLYPVGYQPGTRYPTIALIHGGPAGVWTRAFPGSYGNYGHVWAGQGWVAFYPNVRGSSGYGEEFLLANVRDWGGGDYHDIQSGLDELVRRGVADPARLGQAGWSYGGYMTAWTLTQTDRFRAVMVGAGLTNMISMYSTNDLQTTLEEYFGAEPWDDEAIYWSRSAMAHIKKARTPTLILHGAEDTRVPVGQAQELYMGLKKNDVPVSLVFYPRQGHGLAEPRLQLDKMKREYAFFSRHVLGVEPTGRPPLIP